MLHFSSLCMMLLYFAVWSRPFGPFIWWRFWDFKTACLPSQMAFSCLEFLWFTAIPSTPSHSAKPFCGVSKDTGLVSKGIDTFRLSQRSEFPPSGLGLWPEHTPCSQMCQREPRPSGRSTVFSACGVSGGAVMWLLFPSPKSKGDSGWGRKMGPTWKRSSRLWSLWGIFVFCFVSLVHESPFFIDHWGIWKQKIPGAPAETRGNLFLLCPLKDLARM